MMTRETMTKTRLYLLITLSMVCGTLLVASPAKAQFGKPAKEVKLSASILPATDSQPIRLAITATIDEGWHVYSVTQAKGGPRPTKLQLAESKDYQLAGDFTPSKAPVVHVYEDIWPDLNVEEHSGTVTWTAPLKLASGVNPSSLTVNLVAKGQVCNDELCNNFKKSLSATLK